MRAGERTKCKFCNIVFRTKDNTEYLQSLEYDEVELSKTKVNCNLCFILFILEKLKSSEKLWLILLRELLNSFVLVIFVVFILRIQKLLTVH